MASDVVDSLSVGTILMITEADVKALDKPFYGQFDGWGILALCMKWEKPFVNWKEEERIE